MELKHTLITSKIETHKVETTHKLHPFESYGEEEKFGTYEDYVKGVAFRPHVIHPKETDFSNEYEHIGYVSKLYQTGYTGNALLVAPEGEMIDIYEVKYEDTDNGNWLPKDQFGAYSTAYYFDEDTPTDWGVDKQRFYTVFKNAKNGDNIYLDETKLYFIVNKLGGADLLSGNVYFTYTSFEDVEEIKTIEHDIEEPIGFDQLKMTLQRTECHGISAEVSQLNLEFYGKAAPIIKEAYEEDLDNEVNYIVTSDGIEVYNGIVDLSTYQETEGSYHSVSCKVGEIGVKTTFNNRNETEVDLNSDTTIDGEELALRPTWQSLHIPQKHIAHTNKIKQEETKEISIDNGTDNLYPDQGIRFYNDETLGTYPYITFPIGDTVEADEFGGIAQNDFAYSSNNIQYLTPQYTPSEDHEQKYGTNTRMRVDVQIKANIIVQRTFFVYKWGGGMNYRICAIDKSGNKIIGNTESWNAKDYSVNGYILSWTKIPLNCSLQGELNASESVTIYLEFWYTEIHNGYMAMSAHLEIENDSYIKTLMYDNLQENTKNTNMLMVYDALNTISLMTTENQLPIKSDWYDYSDLSGNIMEQHGGATKAITNGYKIRDIKTESGKEYPMSMSFRDLFESLNAMDCIGWSIVNEEDGLCLRVERWDWFYKDEDVLTIQDVNELKTSLDKDLCVTEFEIGYNKYVTSDVYNSIENLHSERKYASAVKALSNKISAKSKIIADNYAIEETRRAQFQVKPSESFEHDESVFIFELGAGGMGGSFVIRSSAEDCVGIELPIEFINAKLTPRQCAARWANYLFAMNGAKALKYVTSSANSEAGFSTNSGSLLLSMADQPQMENDDIGVVSHKLKAETLEFTYPLTIQEYKKIKSNPYGLIKVNGIQGWIKEFTYSFVDGMAEFKLIPKAK